MYKTKTYNKNKKRKLYFTTQAYLIVSQSLGKIITVMMTLITIMLQTRVC